MQVPTVPPSASAHVFVFAQSALDAQLVLQAPALASQANEPHDVVAPALQVPVMQLAAPMRFPLLPSQAGAAQVVPFG